jgi:hypothetical protein
VYIVHSAFLSKWRAISSYLLHNSPSPQDPSLKVNINRALQDVDTVVAPFASSQFTAQQRLSTLEDIINRAVHLAFTLFSQSATWKFTWGTLEGQDGTHKVVVFPGLQKVADEDGRQLQPPSTLEHSKVVAIS